MHRLFLLVAVLAFCGCNKEPQRGPLSKVRETVPAFKDNDIEYEFYLDRKGRKVPHGSVIVYYGKSNIVYFRGKNKDNKRDGEWTEFARGGKKVGIVGYKNGRYDGAFKAWYSNGQLKATGKNADGVQVGEWVYYNKDGKIAKKETWKDGNKVSTNK